MLLALDIDGTITDKHERIPFESIDYIRRIGNKGIKIVLVSGNAICVLIGLKIYFKIGDILIGENGGVVTINDVIKIYGRDALLIKAKEEVAKNFKKYIVESWQNKYRHSDFAFKIIKKGMSREEITNMIKEFVRKKYDDTFEVVDSGVAIHMHKYGINKGFAIKEVIKELNLTNEKIVAIGDGDTDIPLFKVASVGIAVGNASKSLKKVATYITKNSFYKGFLEASKMIINGLI